MTLRNYAGTCDLPNALVPVAAEDNFRTRLMRSHAESYLDAEKRPYIHLVDGGLNDNLGIRRLLDRLVASGSLSAPFRDAAPGSIRQVVLIAVNSERDLGERIDNSDRVPRTRQVVDTLLFGAGGQVTQVTLAIMSDDRERWRRELAEQRGTLGSPFAADAATACHHRQPARCRDSALRHSILTVPTAFTIDPAQVHQLVEAGHQALRRSAEFQQLRRSLAENSNRDTSPTHRSAAIRWPNPMGNRTLKEFTMIKNERKLTLFVGALMVAFSTASWAQQTQPVATQGPSESQSTQTASIQAPLTLRKLFANADKNGDGKVTKGEAKGHLPITYLSFEEIDTGQTRLDHF